MRPSDGDHDVGGFRSRWTSAFVVRGGERVGQGLRDIEDAGGGETVLWNNLIERMAFDQFHGQKVDAIRFLD